MDRRTLLMALPAMALDPSQPSFAVPTRLDRVGRILVPVRIDGGAPRRFVLDTGADHSAISPELVNTLRLKPGPPVTVHGVTGMGEAPTVVISELTVGSRTLADQLVPVIHTPMMEGADGILGVASWNNERFVVDFQRDRVIVEASPGHSSLRERTAKIHASRVFGGLLVVSAAIGHRAAKGITSSRTGQALAQAVIDTGAERTIGNLALRDLLVGRRYPPVRTTDVYNTIFGATIDTKKADSIIDFGAHEIRVAAR